MNDSVVVHVKESDDSERLQENITPVVIEILFVMFCGWMSGLTKWISRHHAKGIESFLVKFSLPILILYNTIKLDFSAVNWYFLLSFFTSKLLFFLATVVLTLCLSRKLCFGLAGLYAIAITQSNDFALGYPIIKNLYVDTNDDYSKYIYLVAPISLCILNPIAFMIMEYDLYVKQSDQSPVKPHLVFLRVFLGMATNPLIIMCLVGFIFNGLFNHHVPSIMEPSMAVFAKSFDALALFVLGYNLSGLPRIQFNIDLLIPVALVFAKIVCLPFASRAFAYLFITNEPETLRNKFGTLGFLLGCLPTAPAVFVYANQYGVPTEIVTRSVIFGTILAIPWLYFSAKMVLLATIVEADYHSFFSLVQMDLAIINLLASCGLLLIWMLAKRFKQSMFQLLITFVLFQAIQSLGTIICQKIDHSVPWQFYIEFSFFFVGVVGSKLTILFLAAALCIFVNSPGRLDKCVSIFLILLGVIPVVTTVLVVALLKNPTNKELHVNQLWHFGDIQLIIYLILVIVCLLGSVAFLVFTKQPAAWIFICCGENVANGKGNKSGKTNEDDDDECISLLAKDKETKSTEIIQDESLEPKTKIDLPEPEDHLVRTDTLAKEEDEEVKEYLKTKAQQDSAVLEETVVNRVFILVGIVCLFFILSILQTASRLTRNTLEGVYLQLEFLDVCGLLGQGIVAFLFFGFNFEFLSNPVVLYAIGFLRVTWRGFRSTAFGAFLANLKPNNDEKDNNNNNSATKSGQESGDAENPNVEPPTLAETMKNK